jgi:hypothetical protein
MKRRQISLIALGLALACPAASRADGLPVLGLGTVNTAISSPAGTLHYDTRVSGSHTLLQRRTRSGAVIRATRLRGKFVVPLVAYDGSPAGLSHDGRTLVLIRPRTRFPQPGTSLAIIDPGTLTVRRHVHLRGDFSFDAISPTGRWLYLIEYTSRVDPTRYRVRSLDARTGRLLPGEIIDPHDRGETMRGNPVTRVASADGRWAYTLYDGNGHPFVHALDTAGRTARCIDVPSFPTTIDPWQARLRLLGRSPRLLVTFAHRTLATIDTRSLAVVKPVAPRTHRVAAAGRGGGAGSWPAVAGAIAALVLVVAGYGARRSIAHRPSTAGAYRSRS